MHKIEILPSCEKDFKKISPEAQKQLFEKWLPKIAATPSIGKKFVGKEFKKFLKFSFRHKKTDYRIVYSIIKNKVTILIIAIGTRENFYKKLKKRI